MESIQDMKSEGKNVRDQIIQPILNMINQNEKLKEENQQLNKDNQQLIKDKEELKKDKNELKKDKNELKKNNEKFKKDNEELKKNNEELKIDNGKLKKDKEELKEYIAQVKYKMYMTLIGDEKLKHEVLMLVRDDKVNRLFNDIRDRETMNSQDIEAFISEFNDKFKNYFEEKEQQLRIPIKNMIDELQENMIKWKQNKQNRKVEQLSQIKYMCEGLINKTQRMVKQKHRAQSIMLGEYGTNIKMVRELDTSEQIVIVNSFDIDKLDQNRKQIKKYEQNEQQYQISIILMYDSSVDDKMKMMNMIDELNVNHKVGVMSIIPSKSNKFSQEMIQVMIDRYHNVHTIELVDLNDQIDEEIHYKIQELVRKSTLLNFVFGFDGGLYNDDDGFRLMQNYNELIQYKQYLEYLRYDHSIFDKIAKSQEEIEELIDDVNNDTNIINVRELKTYNNHVWIGDIDKLDQDKKQIEEYEQNEKEYEIQMNFYANDDMMVMMNMIDELNVNHKVGQICIRFDDDNKWNQEVIQVMINRYHNVYDIRLTDLSDQVDEKIHHKVQELIRKSTLLIFHLDFSKFLSIDYGSLGNNDDGIKLIKEYNQIIQYKQYLEQLYYHHSRIDRITDQQPRIDQMINKVNRMSYDRSNREAEPQNEVDRIE